LQAIMAALQAGEAVALRGFGRFQLRHRPPGPDGTTARGSWSRFPPKPSPP
jgi:nucleoid DNA-binding protein